MALCCELNSSISGSLCFDFQNVFLCNSLIVSATACFQHLRRFSTEKPNMQMLLRSVKFNKSSVFFSSFLSFQQRVFLNVPFLKGKVSINILIVVTNQFSNRGLVTTLEKVETTSFFLKNNEKMSSVCLLFLI